MGGVGGGGGGGLTWYRGGLAVRNRCEPWAVQATRLRGAHEHDAREHPRELESSTALPAHAPHDVVVVQSSVLAADGGPMGVAPTPPQYGSSAAVFKLCLFFAVERR